VKEIEAATGSIRADMLLVMNPTGEKINLSGEATTEPTFGLPAMWISESQREDALFKNYTVVDPPTVITTHITETIKDNVADLLTYAEVQKLLADIPEQYKKMAEDVVPAQISISGIKAVLQNLLSEQVSIRDLATIIEAVSESVSSTKSTSLLTEHARMRLSRQICHANLGPQGYIPILALSQNWEQTFAESIVQLGNGEQQLAMPPSKMQEFITALKNSYEQFGLKGENPVLLTSPQVRPFVRSIVERFRNTTTVMSQNEIYAKVKIKTLGQL
jgi:flagellar biosynthesis protein FlhA